MSWLSKKIKHVSKVVRHPRRIGHSFANGVANVATAGLHEKFGRRYLRAKGKLGSKIHPRSVLNKLGFGSSPNTVSAGSYSAGNGYVYSGKTLSELMR